MALVRDIALGLAAHGFRRGDRLAVLGDNRPRLYAAILAAQSLGGVALPLDPEADPARLASLLRDAGASAAIAGSGRVNIKTRTRRRIGSV